ncbi:overexpressor of cationic peroxidase 3 isoform X2 [Tasmannia lanceolata]|uniref:overexpressor of cationic peroxidase 3 isoform X2 n=1 Tax=Tasmannia lanceolata TaxID=3420 RepID=UPI004062CABB
MGVGALSSALGFRVISSALYHSQGRSDSKVRLKPCVSLPPRLTVSSASVVAFSRRTETTSSTTSSNADNNKFLQNNYEEDDDVSEDDAIEALFSQLEEDLKNDDLLANDSDGDITEEDLARLEQELEDALGDDELSLVLRSNADSIESDDDDAEEEEEDKPLKLKNWQLRRLASALKIGRRKTSIKSLAAELGLDRALVLELLRDPPPNLLLLCASLPDKVIPPSSEPETKPPVQLESSPVMVGVARPEPQVKVPVHVMRNRWSTQKRLKKVQIETLERVYARTKRPTNTMISSIVHVTNLPRKTVVKWFEDQRLQDGVPHHRKPYQRSETVSTT